MDNNNDLLALNDPKLYVQSTRFCFPNAKYTYFVIWTILFVYSGCSRVVQFFGILKVILIIFFSFLWVLKLPRYWVNEF